MRAPREQGVERIERSRPSSEESEREKSEKKMHEQRFFCSSHFLLVALWVLLFSPLFSIERGVSRSFFHPSFQPAPSLDASGHSFPLAPRRWNGKKREGKSRKRALKTSRAASFEFKKKRDRKPFDNDEAIEQLPNTSPFRLVAATSSSPRIFVG